MKKIPIAFKGVNSFFRHMTLPVFGTPGKLFEIKNKLKNMSIYIYKYADTRQNHVYTGIDKYFYSWVTQVALLI